MSSTFFKFFPPPKFLVMKHSGLDISDDAIHFLQYSTSIHGSKIHKYARVDLMPGLVEGGEIKNEKEIGKILAELDKKHDLAYVKVSLPEEKVYLFQTEVPNTGMREIQQNIESKLEQNVPLTPADAVFYYDLWPTKTKTPTLRASVSVASRVYIENLISLLRSSGMFPVAFEVVPKSIARAVVPANNADTQLIVNIMNKKTGLYVVSNGIVCFTSTIGWGSASETSTQTPQTFKRDDVALLSKEINRVYSYWISHGNFDTTIDQIYLVGHDAPKYEDALQNVIIDAKIPVKVPGIWQNSFDVNKYVPPISHDESLDYVVSAGLAMTS